MKLFKEFFNKDNTKENKERYSGLQSKNLTIFKSGTGYEDSEFLSLVIRPFVHSIGKIKLNYFSGGELVEDNKIIQVIKRPNEFDSTQLFLEKLVSQYLLNNNAYVVIDRRLGIYEPIRLTVLNKIKEVEIEKSLNDNKETNYWYKFILNDDKGDEFTLRKPLEDVIHIKQRVENSDYHGTSPYKSIGNSLDIINKAEEIVGKHLKNNLNIRYILQADEMSNTYSEINKTTEKLLNSFTTQYNGTGIYSIPLGMTLTKMDIDMDLPTSELLEDKKKQIYNYFGVNESILSNTFNEDEWDSFYTSELIPIMNKIVDEFNYKLIPEKDRMNGDTLEFDSTQLLFTTKKTIQNMSTLSDRGILTPNEIRRDLGKPSYVGGDKFQRRLDTSLIDNESGLPIYDKDEEDLNI